MIREYRDRLIADVVTGQVDVRGWQPGPDDVVDDAALAALATETLGELQECRAQALQAPADGPPPAAPAVLAPSAAAPAGAP